MSHACVPESPRPTVLNRRALMWLPAAMLLAWGMLAASGVPLTRDSHAASTGTTTVGATVALDVHIAGTCAAGTTFPSVPLALGSNSLATCGVTFGTNNGATSTLKVESARTVAANSMFCQAAGNSVSAACTNSFTQVGANAVAIAGNQFGVQTTAIGSCTTPTWTLSRYNPVPDSTFAGAGTTICSMTGTTDGNYSLDFVANRNAGSVSGTYQGQATFTAEAS